MDKNTTKVPYYYLAIIAIAGWFALAAQLYLIIQNRVVSVAETVIRYFSFFTILTNIIVALCVTVLLLKPNSKWGNFFSRPTILTAITIYITIVGVVYNAILRFLWQPQGLQFVVDELLHTIVPLLFILLWFLYVPKSGLKYANAFPWLIYPVVYIIYIALRGAITNEYPYPFTDVTILGYGRVAINSLGLFAAFFGLSLFLIAVGKYMKRNKE
ncbi:MAG: Pr6Pr family membrane protein [Ferruginibacter sp.]